MRRFAARRLPPVSTAAAIVAITPTTTTTIAPRGMRSSAGTEDRLIEGRFTAARQY